MTGYKYSSSHDEDKCVRVVTRKGRAKPYIINRILYDVNKTFPVSVYKNEDVIILSNANSKSQ